MPAAIDRLNLRTSMTTKDVDTLSGVTEVPPAKEQLPAVIPPARTRPGKRRWVKPGLMLMLLLIAAIGGGYWWLYPRTGLPPGIASGNGRLEADEIDIDTKFAGRIAKLLADEGDTVAAAQVVALMDTQDLEALLKKAEALVLQAQRTFEEATDNLKQQETQVVFAQQELDRAKALVPKGFETQETLDQRQQQLNGAIDAREAAFAKVGEAVNARDAATHDVEFDKVDIADNALVAPRDGRVEYRIANVGEVLPAGGKVFTMLDTGYVYMDLYLPTADAGRTKVGSEARIVLDSYPGHAIPAVVTFVAAQAQFTPKTVETKDERDTLMFRIRVRIDPERLRTHAVSVRSGLPGMAYVRTDPTVAWPAPLQTDLAK
jgi:HlyD family secretion protein